jgi:RNA recognition motif-containing protein
MDAVGEASTKHRKTLQDRHNTNITPKATTAATVYIGGLHQKITKTHVERLMKPYGEILGLRLIKGYAFCDYASEQQAKAAREYLNDRMLLGRRLVCVESNNMKRSRAEMPEVDARIKAIRRKLGHQFEFA